MLLLAAVAVGLAALVTDGPGRVLAVPGVLLLLALAARDLVLRPVLLADAGGLQVVTGLQRRAYTWEQVEGLRVVRDRRARLLEVDVGSTVVVLGALRLGRAPQDVLPELQELRARSR